MSDLTSELNLALAVGGDDTADYLKTALRSSLTTIDGLFNSGTGHTHSGAHQGGALQFQNLTVAGNLTVTGATDMQGSAVARTTFHGVGQATFDSLVTAASVRVTGVLQLDSTITGNVTATGSLSGTSLALSSNANIGGNLTVSGQCTTSDWWRVSTSGNGLFNAGTNTGIGLDGSGAYLYPSGDRVVSANATQTLGNKTLNSPQINSPAIQNGTITSATINTSNINNPGLAGSVSGQPTWNSGQTFPTVTSSGLLTAGSVSIGSFIYFSGPVAASGAIRLAGDQGITWRYSSSDYSIYYGASDGRLYLHPGAPGLATGATGGSVGVPTQCRGFLQVNISGVGNVKIPCYNQ